MKLPYQEWYETIDQFGKIKTRKLRPLKMVPRSKYKKIRPATPEKFSSIFQYIDNQKEKINENK